MTNVSANARQSSRLSSRFHSGPQSFSIWWQDHSVQRRLPDLILILGVIATFAILWAFYGVVSSSVDRGELRRRTVVLRAEAAWYCGTLTNRGAGESCLRQLNSSAKVDQASN